MENSLKCYICLEEVKKIEPICRCNTPCHVECIKKYLKYNNKKHCTICNGKLNLDLIKFNNYTRFKSINIIINNLNKIFNIIYESLNIIFLLFVASIYVTYNILLPVVFHLSVLSSTYFLIYKFTDSYVSVFLELDYWGSIFLNNFLVLAKINIILLKISLYRESLNNY
tara:strand:+ start:95 stop:601 length:507 start_codon:yes stop_codon:yes gene_type:complete